MASIYALTRPGRSSTGPFSVKIFRNRGPEIARSQPLPDCDLKSDNLQLSNAGLQRFTTVFTASVCWVRIPASPSCGQLLETDIRWYQLSVSPPSFQAWLYWWTGFDTENLPRNSRECGFGSAIHVFPLRQSLIDNDRQLNHKCGALIRSGTRGVNRSAMKLDQVLRNR